MLTARGLPLRATGIVFLAAIVGVLGGLLGYLFLEGIRLLQVLFMDLGQVSLGPGDPNFSFAREGDRWPLWSRIAIPAVGGFLAGACLLLIRNDRSHFGISGIIEVVAQRGRASIKPLRSLLQIMSSAFSISSGGSIGREGANSQFAATVATILGYGRSSRTRTILLGCGIAAGMASAYNAPIAGAIFVMEVVLGNFAMDVLAPIVVASVLSTLVTHQFRDQGPIYESIAENLSITDWRLVLSALLLGGICAIGGIVFRRSLELGERGFSLLPLPLILKLTLGGALLGVIGLWFPETWGNGYTTIETIVDPEVFQLFWLAIAILVMKVIATAVTTGSGGLGGVFTPNLVVGAALGVAFWKGIWTLAPDLADNHIAFAFVGMAGLCAATTHAPITAIILVFELTGDYGLILPLMLCAMTASICSRLVDKDSIYSARLRALGHSLHDGLEELALHNNFVRDIMRHDQVHVVTTASFDEVLEVFNTTRRDAIFVTGTKGELAGHIDLHDIKHFLSDGSLGTVVIAADLTRSTPFARPDESLAAVISRFDDPGLDQLPVVADGPQQVLQGRITRRDLVTCLSEEVLGERKLRAKLKSPTSKDATYVELPAGCILARLAVPDAYVDRAVDSLELAENYSMRIMFLIRQTEERKEERVIVEPNSLLEAGSQVIVIGPEESIAQFRKDFAADS